MTISDAQQDMRHSYLGGAPGLFVSAAVWFIAAAVGRFVGAQQAAWALLGGGMVIFPLSLLLTKLLGRPGKHTAGNPLGTLAMEGTVWFVAGIVIAYAVGLSRFALFFPAMLLLIGGRYLTFQTLYGTKLYWVCGGALIALGFGTPFLNLPLIVAIVGGGVIETLFGILIWRSARS